MRILIIEDERKVAQAMCEGLQAEHYEVRVAGSGEDGFFIACSEPFDLVLLDRMLPGRQGLEVLEQLRRRGINTPVLLVTARDAIEDRVDGLDAGADDYLVKPFAITELLARVRALLRRGSVELASRLQHADLELDFVTRRVHRAGQPIELTAKEFDMLGFLLRHSNRVVSREMLGREVWRVTARATPLDNVIDVTMARLRRKIDEAFERKVLHTIRGVGFMLGDSLVGS